MAVLCWWWSSLLQYDMNSSYKPHEASRLSSTGSYIEEVFNNVLRSRQDSVSSTSSASDTEELDRWLWRLKRQSSDEELEAAGEVSDCMYHVAKGGTHGPSPRLRMFLPALNKGRWFVGVIFARLDVVVLGTSFRAIS